MIYVTAAAPTAASYAQWRACCIPFGAALKLFGWVQQADTGQVVWDATVITMTQVGVVGAVATYTYASYTGPDPRVGMSFIITGFGTGGNNVTATITGVDLIGKTVTVVTTTQANEVHAGSATTTAQSTVSTTGVYEIWKTGDLVGFPIYLKIVYFANTFPATNWSVGTGSNGAGTLTNPTATGIGGLAWGTASSTTVFPMHFSGDSGRFTCLIMHGSGIFTQCAAVSLERSYDSSGTPTASYFTLMQMNNAGGVPACSQQTLFPTGGVTTNETNGFAGVLPKTAVTGNLGSTTHVTPIFPLVGGIGNPMTNFMLFRAADFADNMLAYATIYGVQHAYISYSPNTTGMDSQAVACGLLVRYD